MNQKTSNPTSGTTWHVAELLPLTSAVEKEAAGAFRQVAEDSKHANLSPEEVHRALRANKALMQQLTKHSYYLAFVADLDIAKYYGIHLQRTAHSEPTLALHCTPPKNEEEAQP